MKNIEIVKTVVAYESTHNVEDYIVEGWHVWPLLKALIWLQFLQPVRPNQDLKSLIRKYIAPLLRCRAYLKTVIYKLRCGTRHKADELNHHPVDVIFLTLSERRVVVDGVSFETYTDPFVDMLSELGSSSLVWEQGNGSPSQYSESVKILGRLHAETMIQPPLSLKEPDWFADYRGLVENIIGREIAWAEVAPEIGMVTSRSIVFERWLRKANARFLFFVCWYSPVTMSATMAARRCGVKTVEIQHGLQCEGDFTYASWLRAPSEGYEVMPDVFWCWGKTAAKELKEFNPAFLGRSSAVAGGHLWLNRWCQSARESFPAIKRADNEPSGVKRILVTLQVSVPKLLLEAISGSSLAWVWMIRFHPKRRMKYRAADMRLFLETGHTGLEFERSNESLFFELLNDCDVHVTECSACALEALAFGVPSVILGGSDYGESGKVYYRPFIEKKLMMSADTATDLINAINSSKRIDQASKEISDLFADNDAAKASLSLLLGSSAPTEAKL